MVALRAKVDPHTSTIEVPEGDFRVYREDDRFMVGRIPDGSLLGYFKLELTDTGRVIVRAQVTGQLGLGSLDEARELLEVVGRLAVEHGLAAA
ncbi:MAG TPA: hypothetical protein VF881_03800 [Polyangiaceae bacterium]